MHIKHKCLFTDVKHVPAGLYDAADSKRFYVSMSYFSCRTTACLNRGPIPIFSYLLLGVSKTSDPRDGFLGPYFVATDGINPDTNEVSSCPPSYAISSFELSLSVDAALIVVYCLAHDNML